jgi:hypothetical protein
LSATNAELAEKIREACKSLDVEVIVYLIPWQIVVRPKPGVAVPIPADRT